jgi:hypothetical protein
VIFALAGLGIVAAGVVVTGVGLAVYAQRQTSAHERMREISEAREWTR